MILQLKLCDSVFVIVCLFVFVNDLHEMMMQDYRLLLWKEPFQFCGWSYWKFWLTAIL